MSPSSTLDAQLTQGQIDFRQRMLNEAQFANSQTVEVNSIQGLLTNGTLTFSIPGISGTYTAIQKNEEPNGHPGSDYDYLWSGSVQGEHPGEILILEKDDLVGGFIHVSEGYFAILPIDDNAAFLMEHDSSSITPSCGNNEIVPPGEEANLCNPSSSGCAPIDALVLVTPEARAFLAGLPANPFITTIMVYIGLSTPTIAIGNSGYPDITIRTTPISFNSFNYSFPPSIVADLDNLAVDQAVQNLRDEYRADIVLMLTNQSYAGFAGRVKGFGPSKEDAYGIIEIRFIWNPRWTFAHEVAHLFGARHNRLDNGGDDDAAGCQHGWRFTDPNGITHRTALALAPPGSTRILHYSNPDVNFNGTPTGTANDNNALTIWSTSCDVANFYTAGTYFNAEISTNNPVCADWGDFNVFANVNEAVPAFPGHPPYTYNWSVSGCGSTVDPLGDGSKADVYIGCNNGTINVQLTVNSSDGATATDSYEVVVLPGPCDPLGLKKPDENTELNEIDHLQLIEYKDGSGEEIIYPNPISDQLTIGLHNRKGLFDVELIDANGKLVQLNKASGGDYLKLDFSDLPNGMYLLRLTGEESIVTKKVIKVGQ